MVVCFFHWGVELELSQTRGSSEFAGAVYADGAHSRSGCAPHVLGPRRRATAARWLRWSLGNFVFPSSGAAARTAILQVRLAENGVRGYRLLPALINGFRPQLLGR